MHEIAADQINPLRSIERQPIGTPSDYPNRICRTRDHDAAERCEFLLVKSLNLSHPAVRFTDEERLSQSGVGHHHAFVGGCKTPDGVSGCINDIAEVRVDLFSSGVEV